MKNAKFVTLALGAALSASAIAYDGLYYIGDEQVESLPLKWSVGLNAIYDSNATPTSFFKDSAFSLNPYVGVSFVNITPQTTLDVYARVGGIFYLDSPKAMGSHDAYAQSRIGVNWTHRFSERLRFVSRNFFSYELEPDYSFGVASTRQIQPYFYWQTDNAIGFRWTERLATYTGFKLSGLDYDSDVRNQDRFTWSLYHQFRYQLTRQTVATLEYRYSDTTGSGFSSDMRSHYILAGVEHSFSRTTILSAKVGAQIYKRSGRRNASGTTPFVQLALNSRINDALSLRAFARYGAEPYDTTRMVGLGWYDFNERNTLRIGVSADYALSQRLSLFAGVDYINADFKKGNRVWGVGPFSAGGLSEDLWNMYVGASLKFTDNLYGTLSYNYTYSDSDFARYSYIRNRVSLGIRAEF